MLRDMKSVRIGHTKSSVRRVAAGYQTKPAGSGPPSSVHDSCDELSEEVSAVPSDSRSRRGIQ